MIRFKVKTANSSLPIRRYDDKLNGMLTTEGKNGKYTYDVTYRNRKKEADLSGKRMKRYL